LLTNYYWYIETKDDDENIIKTIDTDPNMTNKVNHVILNYYSSKFFYLIIQKNKL
jgi:hypothetical protein